MDMNLDKSLFQPLKQDEKNLNVIARPSETYWQDAIRRLKQNKVAIFAFVLLMVLMVVAIVGPFLTKFDYSTSDYGALNVGPNATHWFGTDMLGRDLFTRTLWGARISLSVGIVSAIINFVIGVIYGGISGYYGGFIDMIMMRIVDILWSVPVVLYVILLMVVLGSGLINVYIALGISYWVVMARIVRGQVLSLKQQEFVLAARALGAKDFRIIIRHLVPNCMGPIIVMLTMSIPTAIFTEAFLSFIGLGVSAPMASLGVLCNDALETYRTYFFQLFYPALTLCLIMLAFNLFGDGLRDALDPKMRK
jgi:oligopeptide transport system permease protein